MQAVIVLLEFFDLPDFSQCKHVICVTQRAYERVLSALYGNEYPEQLVTSLLHPDVCVSFSDSEPFDLSQVALDGEHTLRDYLPPIPFDMVVQDIRKLTSFVHSDTYVYTQPNGGMYLSNITPGDSNILSFLEFVRCLYARMLCYTHSHRKEKDSSPTKPRTLYVRGGGQHGTVTWGAVCAVLRNTSEPYEHFAGDSFGAAIAVMCALDKPGTALFFDRVIDTCHRMQLDTQNRPLNKEAAIEFVCTSLHEHIDRTLSDLDLPVDILVTNLERGVEHAVLNRHTAPDMKLKDALIASMSIPVIIGEHCSYLDGGLTAWDYVGRLGPESTVVGLAMGPNVFMQQTFGMFGSAGTAVNGLMQMWQDLTGQKDVLCCHNKPYQQFCVPVRDPDVPLLGGTVGTTSWHILNFQYGFDITSAAL
jgi:hypothetical protein